MIEIRRSLLLCAALLPAPALFAAEWSHELGIEGRYYFDDAQQPVQHGSSLSLSLESEFFHDWDSDRQRIAITPFVRADQHDSERSHADLRELYWRRSFGDSDLYVGVRKLFWGVTESHHLVDIVNQTDLVENPDGEDKLGQPMVSLFHMSDYGDFELFVMPWFRERTFAGVDGRLRAPFVVDSDSARYQSGDEEQHIDSALRWSHVIDDWDIGLAWFHGTDRNPQLLPTPRDGTTVLTPFYPQLDQLGLDLQLTYDAWLWKLETVTRRHDSYVTPTITRSSGSVGGIEYTWYGVLLDTTDIGLVLEYQYDSREGTHASPANNDIAIGTRFTVNDEADTTLLALVAADLDHRSRFISVEGSRRLSDNLSIDIEARLFSNAQPQSQLYPLRSDDYLELLLTRYF